MAHSWSERTTYSNKTVNWGLRYILQTSEKMLATPKFGSEREGITLYQGSKSLGSLSGNTHAGWDAYDRSTFNNRNRNKVLRLLGVMDHMRTPAEGPWIAHGHGIVCGGDASDAGQRQVTAYYNRRNGLRSNTADTGYRMEVFPLYVFPEKAVGRPGKRYCTTACHVYEQPTSSPKVANLGPIRTGDVLDAVAVVNVGGKYWFVTADGRFGYEGNFSKSKPTTTPVPEDPIPVPEPEPVLDFFEARGLLNNVCADYRTTGMKSFNQSIIPLTNIFENERASHVWTCESGNYADGAKINEALDWGGRRYGATGVSPNDASYVLHGGAVPVTTAVHQDPSKRRIKHEGQGTTYGTRNRWYTWTVEEDRVTGIDTLHMVTHCEFEPKGPNKIKKWNEHREKQMDAVFDAADALVEKYPSIKAVFVVGDVNGARGDSQYPGGDGPGNAAKAHSFKEFHDIAKVKINGSASTHARPGGLKTGAQIDRGWCKGVNGGSVEILEFEIVNCYPWTDHNAVSVLWRVRA
jgi:hypothetical protein